MCSAAARHRDEPLWATASTWRRVLMIEVRGAWGADPVTTTALGDHVDARWRSALRGRGIRILAARRGVGSSRDTSPLRLHYVDCGRPGVTPPRSWRCEIDDLSGVVDATAALANGDPAGPDGGPGGGWRPHDEPLVLVCTNGRHDQCCAVQGRPVAKALREGPWGDRLWESTHVGGDRFAANVVLLPQGIYLGRCPMEGINGLLDDTTSGRLAPAHYRGLSTRSWAEQAAEHFVRTRSDRWDLASIGASTVVATESDRAVVRLQGPDGEVELVVAAHHDPVTTPLTCTGPGGQTILRWELVALRQR